MLTLQYGRLTGGGLDEELKSRAKLVAGREEAFRSLVSPVPLRTGAATHNCQMVDFFFS